MLGPLPMGTNGSLNFQKNSRRSQRETAAFTCLFHDKVVSITISPAWFTWSIESQKNILSCFCHCVKFRVRDLGSVLG